MEDGVKVQPFVKDVRVRIDRAALRRKRDEFDYQTLTGNMLDVTLVIEVEGVRAVAEMRYVTELRYPLMFVKEISEV